LHMLNSSHIQKKIENSPKLQALFSAASGAGSKPPKPNKNRRGSQAPPPVNTGPTSEQKKAEVINQLYLTILSRFPTEQEMKTVAEYMQSGSKREAAVDLAWALFNSSEFLYRH